MDCIYLDHNATTPTRPEVVDAMAECYAVGYANPASPHRLGQAARQRLEAAREGIAELLGANLSAPNPDRLLFTSGGTEANNLAILGLTLRGDPGRGYRPDQPSSLIISAIEHPCVVQPAEQLLDRGWRVDTIPVDGDGVVCASGVPSLLRDDTRLVSCMLGNHDTGVIQPVAEIAATAARAGVPVHTDAVQAIGKIPVSFRDLGVAAMTVAAHKFQGPLGIGALVLRHDVEPSPLVFGGHQQGGVRPGTESVALAVGMFTALKHCHEEQEAHAARLAALRDRLEGRLRAGFSELAINGIGAARLPQTANVAFPGHDAQVLLMTLDMAGVACSVGSACSSGAVEVSPTLQAMNLPPGVAESSLRFSVGATTTEAEIDEAAARVLRVCMEMAF